VTVILGQETLNLRRRIGSRRRIAEYHGQVGTAGCAQLRDLELEAAGRGASLAATVFQYLSWISAGIGISLSMSRTSRASTGLPGGAEGGFSASRWPVTMGA
jgi:hypothetical protein